MNFCTFRDSWRNKCNQPANHNLCEKHAKFIIEHNYRKNNNICTYNRWDDEKYRCNNETRPGDYICPSCHGYIKQNRHGREIVRKSEHEILNTMYDSFIDSPNKSGTSSFMNTIQKEYNEKKKLYEEYVQLTSKIQYINKEIEKISKMRSELPELVKRHSELEILIRNFLPQSIEPVFPEEPKKPEKS